MILMSARCRDRYLLEKSLSLIDPGMRHSNRLVSGLLEYAKMRGVSSILFCLDDPEDQDGAAIVRKGAKLSHEARYRCCQMLT